MDQLESLHVCSFHIPHTDPPVSLKCVFSTEITHGSTSAIACVFFLVTTTSHFACVFFSHTTYGSTNVIACVFFLLTTTRVIEMCALFRDHTWIHQCHCMCFLFTIHPWIPPVSFCMCVLFSNNNQSHFASVISSHTTYGSTSVIACLFFLVTTTRVIEMCVLITYHLWIHQYHCMCVHLTNN